MVNDQLLIYFAKTGCSKLVKLLIPISDPMADDSCALQVAAINGHTECVKLLIPVSDPRAGYSMAFRWADAYGHTECVKLLIPVSDPRDLNDLVLKKVTQMATLNALSFYR